MNEEERLRLSKDIYLKAWDIYQARVSWFGEIRWRVVAVAIAISAGMLSYGYIHKASGLYAMAGAVGALCLYLESLYYRIQAVYISKSLDVEKAIRDLVLEANDPHIPRLVVDTEPRLGQGPSIWYLCRTKRILLWFPYVVIIVGAVIAGIFF